MSTTLVWIAIAVYIAVGLWVALIARRHLAAGTEEFYLGGRKITGLVSAASYAATTYSTFMLIGLAGFTYRGGVGALGFELVYFAGLGLVVVFGPRFWLVGRSQGYVTPSEMLGARYESRLLAGAVALLSCIFLIPYCAAQLLGIGYLLSGVTGGGISFGVGILIAALLGAVWTLVAGLRSVAWTDALQAVLMMVSAILALGFVIESLGGLGSFLERIEAERGQWLTQPGPGFFSFWTFVALTLPWFFFSLSNPQVSQRLFTVRDPRAMRTMIVGFLSFGLIFTLISILWGFAALLKLPELASPDQATPNLLATGAVPVWLSILLIVGILAAAITTVDSIALSLASMVGRDVYRAGVGTADDARELLVGKFVVLAMITAAALFATLKLQLIVVLAVTSSAGLMVTVPAIVGAFFWRQATRAGALASVFGGTILVAWFKSAAFNPLVVGRPLGIPDAVWIFAATVILYVAVSLATTPPADRGRAFIDDLRPQLDRLKVW
jgi:SSS family solute:Na+ symporter